LFRYVYDIESNLSNHEDERCLDTPLRNHGEECEAVDDEETTLNEKDTLVAQLRV